MATSTKIAGMGDAPVVALHSSASNSSQWKSLIADLDDRREVFAYNLPGYGSDLECTHSITGMETVARSIIREILRLGAPVHLVGHSYGGGIAIKAALLRPDLVKSLTLFEPASFHILKDSMPSDALLLHELSEIEHQLAAAAKSGSHDQGMRVFTDYWAWDGFWAQASHKMREKLVSYTNVILTDLARSASESWALDELAGLEMPMLMLMGMDSPAIAQRIASLVVRHAPTAELAMLPGLGHMAPVFAPQWVNPRISQHIARAERAPANFSWPQKAAA